jgi:hypothetical protein
MKLTSNILKSIVAEEVAKFKATKSTEDAAAETEEVDADGYGDAKNRENEFNYYKALGLEESRLIRRLGQIHEAKKAVAKKVAAKKAIAKKEAVAKKTASKKK